MTKLYPYLNFAGNAGEAFEFYRSVFGGEFKAVVRFKDMPWRGFSGRCRGAADCGRATLDDGGP